MGLVELLVALIVLGLVWYVIQNFLPIDSRIKGLIMIVLVLIIVLYLLGFIGV